jgi:hypothetical protein
VTHYAAHDETYAAWSRVKHFGDFPDAIRISHFAFPLLPSTSIIIIVFVFDAKYTPLGCCMPERVCTTC